MFASARRARVWWRIDPRRTTAIAVVLSIHAAVLIMVSRPAQPAAQDTIERPAGAANVLQVRLIDVAPSSPPPAQVMAPSQSGFEARQTHKPRLHHVAKKPIVMAHPGASASSPSTPGKLSLKLPGRRKTTKDWSVGRSWGAPRRAKPRLPGAGKVYGAPTLHTVDPRSQGVGGVARWITGHLKGAVNPHCVDVDTWRSMSPAELGRRHISPKQVEETARYYGCVPPVRGDLSDDPS
jgi:hypothetical protein